MARASDDDPAPVKKRVDPLVVAAVARELGARGWSPAPAGGAPDVTLHYYLLVTIGTNAQVFGQFLPAVPEWGVPPFNGGTQSLDIITRGSLVLDISSTSLSRVVWRGVAQTDLDESPVRSSTREIIDDAARELDQANPAQKVGLAMTCTLPRLAAWSRLGLALLAVGAATAPAVSAQSSSAPAGARGDGPEQGSVPLSPRNGRATTTAW